MYNKYQGSLQEYIPVRSDRNRFVISYGFEKLTDDLCSWYEVIFYKKQHPNITLNDIKLKIFDDVNTRTDEKILTAFVWNDKKVWLSAENLFNFKAAYDLAVQTGGLSLPVKFKLGEDDFGEPIYHTFYTMEEFSDFYTKAILFINSCLNDGWMLKDNIDWNLYLDILLN